MFGENAGKKSKKKTNNALSAIIGDKYRIAMMGGAAVGAHRSSSATNKVVLQVTGEGIRKTVGKFEWSSYELNNVQVCSRQSCFFLPFP